MSLQTIAYGSVLLIILSFTGIGAWVTFRDNMWLRGTVNRWRAARYIKQEFRQKRADQLEKVLTRSNPTREDWWK